MKSLSRQQTLTLKTNIRSKWKSCKRNLSNLKKRKNAKQERKQLGSKEKPNMPLKKLKDKDKRTISRNSMTTRTILSVDGTILLMTLNIQRIFLTIQERTSMIP